MALLWLAADPDDPDEITRWWNTRALRPRRWHKGMSVLATPNAVADGRFATDLRSFCLHGVFTQPHLVLASDSVPETQLHDMARSLGFARHPSATVSQPLLPVAPPDPDANLTYTIGRDLAGRWASERTSGTVSLAAVSVQRPATRVRAASPLAWNPAMYATGGVSLRIGGAPFDGPRLSPVARLYHDNARWHHGRLELQSTVAPVYDFQLRMPGPAEILRAACSAAGASYELGDKGRQVQGVWALAPDPSIFRRQLVIDVIRVQTPDCSRELIRQLKDTNGLTEQDKRELKTLAAANRVTVRTLADITSLLRLTARATPTVAAALHDLVTAGMVVRGLLADCPVCRVQHLYALGEARTPPACPGCGAEAVYAGNAVTGEPALHYRINTLVQTLSLNGGLAPLAATALLTSQGAHVVPGAEIFHAGAGAGEVDLLGWRGETLFAGEAKMSAAQFAEADHRKDVGKSALLGADEHYAVCLQALPPPTRDAIQAACDKAGIALVVLGPEDLLAP